MENKHTITLRYIREKLYYVNVPDILWDYLVEKNCNRSEILVYMYYLREWSKKQRSNIASISSETLAEKLGISPKSVKNANKQLESLELIERRQETRFSQIDLRYSSTAITTPKIPDELTKRIEIQGQRMRNYHDPVLGEIISIDDLNEKLNKFEADQIRNLRTNAQRIKDIIYHYLINSPNSVDNHFDKMDEIAIDIKNKVIGSGLPAEDQKVLMIQKFSEYLAAQIAWSIYTPDGQLNKNSDSTPTLEAERSALTLLTSGRWERPRNFPYEFIDQCFPSIDVSRHQEKESTRINYEEI